MAHGGAALSPAEGKPYKIYLSTISSGNDLALADGGLSAEVSVKKGPLAGRVRI